MSIKEIDNIHTQRKQTQQEAVCTQYTLTNLSNTFQINQQQLEKKKTDKHVNVHIQIVAIEF